MKDRRRLMVALIAAALGTAIGAAGSNLLRGDKPAAGGHADEAGHKEGEGHGDEGGEHDGEEGTLLLNEARLKAAGIGIEKVAAALIENTTPLPGEVRFNQDKLAEITPRIGGVIVSIQKNLGDPVRQGEVLATMESQTLAEWRSAYLAGEKRLELARANHEREKRLWQDRISAEQDYLNASKEKAEAEIALQGSRDRLLSIGAALPRQNRDLARYELRAPLAGTIVAKHATQGEAVKDDATLFQIANLDELWAEAAVYPKLINQVQQGQRVTVVAQQQGLSTEGRITHIGALIGEKTRTATARVSLDNKARQWRPGMYVNIAVADGAAQVPVAVKPGALQTLDGKTVVFVRQGDTFEARQVVTGRQSPAWVEISRGLKAGEAYAATNSYVVKAEIGKATASHDH